MNRNHPYADIIRLKKRNGAASATLSNTAEADTLETVEAGEFPVLTGLQCKNRAAADVVSILVKAGATELFRWQLGADEGLIMTGCIIDAEAAGADAGDDLTCEVTGGATGENVDYSAQWFVRSAS